MTTFDACKEVSAADVARDAGIILHQRGAREWACCPLHGEKTPSLMFDKSGRWHCFGCHRGGDAVDFYSALYGVSLLEAAQAIAENQFDSVVRQKRPAIPPAKILKERIEAWKLDQWRRWCNVYHMAGKQIDQINEAYKEAHKKNLFYEPPAVFWRYVEARATANIRLDELQTASPSVLADMMLREIECKGN